MLNCYLLFVEKNKMIVYNCFGVIKMSKRFITDESNINIVEKNIKLKGDELHHINVLRHKTGDNIYINEYEVEIIKINKDILEGKIIGKLPQKGIPKVNITLIQSYLKSDKMEYVVQKAVELGVKNIVPVISKNTVVKMEEKDKQKKVERLSKIVKEAVEQCGRTDIVNVDCVQQLSKLDLSVYDKVLICHETSNVNLKATINNLENANNIAILIGPEGGFDDSEVSQILKNDNATDVSLGERILRAETASLALLSILNYELN